MFQHSVAISLFLIAMFAPHNLHSNLLHNACKAQDSDELLKIIAIGEPYVLTIKQLWSNEQDDDGNTPLHIACANLDFSCVSIIIKHLTPDVNLQNRHGDTPLILACRAGTLQSTLNKLKENKKNQLQILEDLGDDALLFACTFAIVQYLLEQDTINVNIKNKDNETALTYAKKVPSLTPHQLPLVDALREKGALDPADGYWHNYLKKPVSQCTRTATTLAMTAYGAYLVKEQTESAQLALLSIIPTQFVTRKITNYLFQD